LHFEQIANVDDQRRLIVYAPTVTRTAEACCVTGPDSGVGSVMKKKYRISEREYQGRLQSLLSTFNTQLQPLKSLETVTKKRRALKNRQQKIRLPANRAPGPLT
jgi:hypothetical protein